MLQNLHKKLKPPVTAMTTTSSDGKSTTVHCKKRHVKYEFQCWALLKLLGFLPENVPVCSTCCCTVSTATWEELYQEGSLSRNLCSGSTKSTLLKKTKQKPKQQQQEESTPSILLKTSSKGEQKKGEICLDYWTKNHLGFILWKVKRSISASQPVVKTLTA